PDLGDARPPGPDLLRHRERLRGGREPVRRHELALRYRVRGPVVLAVRTAGGGARLPAGQAVRGAVAGLRVLGGGPRLLSRASAPGWPADRHLDRSGRRYIALQKFSKWLPVFALAAVAAWATAASEEQAIRIGVVDIDQAISSTEEGKAAREELSRKQREAETKVQPMIDRYRALEEELKTKKFVLSDDALYQKQLDLAA